ncbi:CD2 antigen cytoplasmic tail-binding protein [Zostera marina]|uniref:CD2 antigen cytoplasmic tail-binding protein n=1 Tax=Zostera marina TaxID=29655 RepID=A0A0K9PLY9_ZOSMR|nr:CD2 antigen cytoplasmic tail-binding protein [Zostera marina]
MEARGKGKRPLSEVEIAVDSGGGDQDGSEYSSKKTSEDRKVRFPKGKKVKKGEQRFANDGEKDDDDSSAFGSWMNPKLAAKQRANRRNRNREKDRSDQFGKFEQILARSEIKYKENADFEDDGIQIEPFNLDQEREEGYFDEQGNFVEYTNKDVKDAWLDSVDVEPRFAEKNSKKPIKEEGYQDLSSEDVGKIKRNIANTLNPGETVIQALKRLKGTSSSKKIKMPVDIKRIFDQLTEDAMKLLENGEYNVYHEKRETFNREAEGYERVARARGGNSNDDQELWTGQDIFSQDIGNGNGKNSVVDMDIHPSGTTVTQIPSFDDGTELDMFGDGDENNISIAEPSTSVDQTKTGVESVNDYVFDDSSGYYYSNTLGYYYDPTSGLYCSAATGTWYSFNEQSNTYDEVECTVPPVA